MRTKKRIPALLLSFFLIACGSSRQQASEEGTETGADTTSTSGKGKKKAEWTKATVRDYRHLDGCHYMLITPEEKKLYPLNMDTAYYKDSLKVRVRYRKKEAITTCMAGQNIEVLEVEKLD